MAKISAVIPTIRGREELLNKLLSTIPDYCEVIIEDDEKMSLSEKRNHGAKRAKGEYILFIDDDNYLADKALDYMMAFRLRYIGVMGMVACYDTSKNTVADGGSIRNYVSGFTVGINTNRDVRKLNYMPYEVSEVANAFMIRRSLFNALGGLDAANFPIDLDEADICRRIKNRGYKIMICPLAICYHKSQTYSMIPDFRRPKNAYYMGRNRQIYQRKHLTPVGYAIYLVVFFPIFIALYCACLLYRRKPEMVKHFLKGVADGISGRKTNTY